MLSVKIKNLIIKKFEKYNPGYKKPSHTLKKGRKQYASHRQLH